MSTTVGEYIRYLRTLRGEPLRIVAAATDVDSTLLSKIERNQRLPTESQIAKLADHFGVPVMDIEARVIADMVLRKYGDRPGTLEAARIIQARMETPK